MTAVLVLLRAPDVQQARLFFVAIMTFITFCTPFHGRSYALSYLSRGILWYGVGGVGFGLVWLWVICFPGELARRDRLSPVWALFASVIWYTSRINYVTSGFPTAIVPALKGTCDAVLMGGGLAIATRNYRRVGPIGRRRVKWLLYGAYIAVVPLIVARTLTIARSRRTLVRVGVRRHHHRHGGVPARDLVAIVRYNLFDIDRLITATASYSVVLVGLLGFLLALLPPLARAASAVLGVDRTFAQVRARSCWRRSPCRWGGGSAGRSSGCSSAERYAFERGMQQLLRDLSSCAGPGAVMSLVAERTGNLLRPERLVLYTRAGDAFVPTAVRGVRRRRHRRREPACTDRGRRRIRARRGADCRDGSRDTRDPLATLAPRWWPACIGDGSVAALLCLGPKRSGDIYTSTDVTLLAAVAEKASSELAALP